MNRFPNILKAFVITAIMGGLSSCYEDYPEGPDFDLRSENTRICATWQVEDVVPNEEEFDLINSDTRLYILDGGNFSIRIPLTINMMGTDTTFEVGMSGNWDWADGKKSFTYSVTELNTGFKLKETSRILKLEYDHFWFEMPDTSSGKVYTIKCKRI